MGHLTQEQLELKVKEAKGLVVPGDLYYHYKHPDQLYKIVDLCLIEETEDIGVLYKPLYWEGTEIIWMRPLEVFLSDVEVDGKVMKRFTRK